MNSKNGKRDTTMRSCLWFTALAALILTMEQAKALPPCTGPFCNQAFPGQNSQSALNQRFSGGGYQVNSHPQGPPGALFNRNRGPVLPVFQAAPWYLYWPYDGHFQTVAPPAANAGYYPPPTYGANGMPYFPPQQPGYYPGANYNTYPMAIPQSSPEQPPVKK